MSERRTKEPIDVAGHRADKSLERALAAIPVFPLPQVVLFPHAILPLHVFEPRYRAMMKDCLATHGALVVAQLVGGEDEYGRPRLAPIAGGGIVIEHQPLADGRSNIVVLGQERLFLEELPPQGPYRIARATILRDLPGSVPDHDRAALVAAATMFASEVKKHDPQFSFKMPGKLEVGQVADLCAYQLIVDAAARQAILDELDPRARVSLVVHQLALQQGTMMRTSGDRVLN
jgi:ATP-dependent Lon protease